MGEARRDEKVPLARHEVLMKVKRLPDDAMREIWRRFSFRSSAGIPRLDRLIEARVCRDR